MGRVSVLMPMIVLLLCVNAFLADGGTGVVLVVDPAINEIALEVPIDAPDDKPIAEVIPQIIVDTLDDTPIAEVIPEIVVDTLDDTSIAEITQETIVDTLVDTPITEITQEAFVDTPDDASIPQISPSIPQNVVTTGSSAASAKIKRLKFGRRVAYNNSSVSGLSVRVHSFDGQTLTHTDIAHETANGFGFEVSGIFFFVITDAVALNFAPGLIFRKPVSTKYVGVGELAVSFPMLLEWRPFGAVPLHALVGVQPDVPVYTRIKWSNEPHSALVEPQTAFGERHPLDFGLVIGAGGYPNERLALDARMIIGLADFDRIPGRRLNQFNVGVSYIR